MRLTWLGFVIFAIGCGTSTPAGTPQNGDATLQYGSTTQDLTVGSAILDPNGGGSGVAAMLVQLGTDGVTCDVNLVGPTFPPHGEYVYFDVDPTTPMDYAEALVSVISSTNNNLSLDESNGTVSITSIDTRVMGTVTFNSSTDEAGAIVATGTFDVEKCF
jgi:hypothetical protein